MEITSKDTIISTSYSPSPMVPPTDKLLKKLEKLFQDREQLNTMSGNDLKLLADIDIEKFIDCNKAYLKGEFLKEIVRDANKKLMEIQERKDMRSVLMVLPSDKTKMLKFPNFDRFPIGIQTKLFVLLSNVCFFIGPITVQVMY